MLGVGGIWIVVVTSRIPIYVVGLILIVVCEAAVWVICAMATFTHAGRRRPVARVRTRQLPRCAKSVIRLSARCYVWNPFIWGTLTLSRQHAKWFVARARCRVRRRRPTFADGAVSGAVER